MANFASDNNVLILKKPEFSKVINEVSELFPHATLLATVRDPRDQICSELEVSERRINAGVYDPIFTSRNVAALSKTYLAYISKLVQFNNSSDRLSIMKYEDLVLKPHETLMQLKEITKLDLQFDPTENWAKVSEHASLHTGPSSSDLYGNPISTNSVNRFQHDLTRDEIKIIEEQCGSIMTAFNYKTFIN